MLGLEQNGLTRTELSLKAEREQSRSLQENSDLHLKEKGLILHSHAHLNGRRRTRLDKSQFRFSTD